MKLHKDIKQPGDTKLYIFTQNMVKNRYLISKSANCLVLVVYFLKRLNVEL